MCDLRKYTYNIENKIEVSFKQLFFFDIWFNTCHGKIFQVPPECNKGSSVISFLSIK